MASKSTVAIVVCVAILLIAAIVLIASSPRAEPRVTINSSPRAEPTVTIYQTGFSSDPGWTTNNPSHYHWDSVSGTYYSAQVDGAEDYAFILLPGLDPSRTWRLEYDIKPILFDWAGNSRLMLSDAAMRAPGADNQEITLDFNRGSEPQGQTPSIYSGFGHGHLEGSGHFLGSRFSTGQWYHALIEWSPSIGKLLGRVTIKETGALLGEKTFSFTGSFHTIDRLAMTTVGDKSYAPGARGIAYYDNIVVSQRVSGGVIPKPLSLVFMGIAFVGVVAIRLRRWRKGKATQPRD
jgi:hypothetical protein